MFARILLPLSAATAIAAALPASGFDLEAYRAHLLRTRDLTAAALLEQHQPFGPYLDRVAPPATDPEYLAPILTRYAVTAGERELLDRNGFFVSERLAYPSYGAALLDVWHADLPVFVSSDAILHAMHKSYVDILASVETNFLSPDLQGALDALHAGWPSLDLRYGSSPPMRASLDDVDVYLTVARSLLAGQRLPSAGGNDATVGEVLDLVAAEQPCPYPLFNPVPRTCDFSQMRPRGHYTQTETLQRYFRSMMWLGRTEMRLTAPPDDPGLDITRERIDAVLVRELLAGSNAASLLARMESVLRPLVGSSDNITPTELEMLTTTLGLERADALLDDVMMARFGAELQTGRYRAQAINSQILYSDVFDPKPMDLPYVFLLLGQRFVLDSYVTGNVVFDRIVHQGGKVFRGLPSPLDVLYTLGNDDVLPLLEAELVTFHYAPNLSALRYLIDGYEPEYWRQSLYTVWLQAIRSLSATGRLAGAPQFMRTVAWQQEKMNTQLASWTELRHDNLLYAKQSYTGGAICSFPRSYVEPVPELYRTLETFGLDAQSAFGALPPALGTRDRIVEFFGNWADTMNRLAGIAEKELAGTPLGETELQFLREMLYLGNAGCVEAEFGWYRQLYFGYSDAATSDSDLLIADVHTQPTDEQGAPVGHVLHVATGNPELGVFVVAPPGMPLTAFVGPVASYQEHVTSNFARLTDEEWEVLYAQSPPGRPDWTYAYLADVHGESRPGGRRIPAGETPPDPVPVPSALRLVLAPNYPNPFNPETRIPLRIDAPAPVWVRLAIFDARGLLVRTLLDEVLPSGTYHTRWDGMDDVGRALASGTYVARVRAGNTTAARKLVLLK